MAKIVVATSNLGKVEELSALLPKNIILRSLHDIDITLPPETGASFSENAEIKARAAAKAGIPAIADDSGIVVDALGGRPGVHSARFSGESATDQENNLKLLTELLEMPDAPREAAFVSVVVLAFPSGELVQATGSVHGVIVDSPRGSGGFGYDPLFEIQDEDTQGLNGQTMAEISLAEKNVISHRARAYRQLLEHLADRPNLWGMAFGKETFVTGSQ